MEGTLYDHSKAKLLVNQQYLRTLSNQTLVLDGVRAIDIPDGRGAASAANHGGPGMLSNSYFKTIWCHGIVPICAIVAKQDICGGSEVLVDYGSGYNWHAQVHPPPPRFQCVTDLGYFGNV